MQDVILNSLPSDRIVFAKPLKVIVESMPVHPIIPYKIPVPVYIIDQKIMYDQSFQSITLYKLRSVLTLSDNIVIHNGFYWSLTQECHPKYWTWMPWWNSEENFGIKNFSAKIEPKLIIIGHQHSSDFGHWFLETLPEYLILPKFVLYNASISLPYIANHIIEGLSLLETSVKPIGGKDNPIFAREYYTVHFKFCGNLVKNPILRFRELLVKKYGLDKEQPYRFALFNRWNMSRCMANFDEFMTSCRMKWPNIKWEEGKHIKGLEAQMRYFNTIKLFHVIHGSVLCNTIVMQPETVVCDLQMEQWLLSFQYLSLYTSKYYVCSDDPKISWRNIEPNVVDIGLVTGMVELGLQILHVIP